MKKGHHVDDLLMIRTVSGNWFEHFERFVAQILYIQSFVVGDLQGNSVAVAWKNVPQCATFSVEPKLEKAASF